MSASLQINHVATHSRHNPSPTHTQHITHTNTHAPWQADPSHDALWARLAALPPDAPLPPDLPAAFYFSAASYVRGAQYADRLAEWAAHLPAEK